MAISGINDFECNFNFVRMTHNEITYSIRKAAFKVHSIIGPGLLESVYELALANELAKLGHRVSVQQVVTVYYDGFRLEKGFYMDILVDDSVIIEIKSVETLSAVHFKQLISYLKLSQKKVGLLINFNSETLKDRVSLHRIVNNL
jgi:GxxExxY protein